MYHARGAGLWDDCGLSVPFTYVSFFFNTNKKRKKDPPPAKKKNSNQKKKKKTKTEKKEKPSEFTERFISWLGTGRRKVTLLDPLLEGSGWEKRKRSVPQGDWVLAAAVIHSHAWSCATLGLCFLPQSSSPASAGLSAPGWARGESLGLSGSQGRDTKEELVKTGVGGGAGEGFGGGYFGGGDTDQGRIIYDAFLSGGIVSFYGS